MKIAELFILSENQTKLRAYKLKAPEDATIDRLWKWVEEQTVLTIEDIVLKDGVVHVFPHFDDRYDGKQRSKLQASLNSFF